MAPPPPTAARRYRQDTARLAACLRTDTDTDTRVATSTSSDTKLPPLNVKAVPIDHQFIPKKGLRDDHHRHHSDGRPLESYVVPGLLKANWLEKHTHGLPSVVVVVLPFSTAWSPQEWAQREQGMAEHVNRVKEAVASRDGSRLLLVFLRDGPLMDTSPKDIVDERLTAVRRHLGVESKLTTLLHPSELDLSSPVMRKLFKNVREYAASYYLTQARRIKKWEKSLNRSTQQRLLTRYCFKVGFYYEMQGNHEKMLRYYRMSYEYLTQLPRGGSDDYVPPPPGTHKQSALQRARAGTMRRGASGPKASPPPSTLTSPTASPPGSGGLPDGALPTSALQLMDGPAATVGETLAAVGAAAVALDGGAAEEQNTDQEQVPFGKVQSSTRQAPPTLFEKPRSFTAHCLLYTQIC